LRLLVRERLTKGDSDQQVLDFLVSRYGAFVLLKPPFEKHTLLLWGLPPLVLIVGLIWLLVRARRHSSAPSGIRDSQSGRGTTAFDFGRPRCPRALIAQLNLEKYRLQTLQKFNPADRTS
jgi:cytochrome c-type biogenesis protein CcmH